MMVLSYQLPEYAAYREAALALLDIERDIEARQNSKSHRDEKMLARLIIKRDSLRCEVEPLKAAWIAADRAAWERLRAPLASLPITPASREAGDGLDIPAFLRRQA